MKVLGVEWLAVNADSGRRLVFSLAFIAIVLLAGHLLRALAGIGLNRTDLETIRTKFWTRQTISLLRRCSLSSG